MSALPPEIIPPPRDTKAFLGSAVTLECGSYGSPDPIVTWKKINEEGDATPVESSKLYSIQKEALIIT